MSVARSAHLCSAGADTIDRHILKAPLIELLDLIRP
jgi:hypothetical protein